MELLHSCATDLEGLRAAVLMDPLLSGFNCNESGVVLLQMHRDLASAGPGPGPGPDLLLARDMQDSNSNNREALQLTDLHICCTLLCQGLRELRGQPEGIWLCAQGFPSTSILSHGS